MSSRTYPKPISQEAQKVLERLLQGVDDRHTRKLDNGGECIMAVIVECVGPDRFSVAHYYEQNGDLMADPEVVFWRRHGRYYPCEYKQDGLGLYQELIEFDPNDYARPVSFRPRAQADCASFCATWMRNIKHQQGGLRALTDGLRGPARNSEPEPEPPPVSPPPADPTDVSMFKLD
jgi:hypothetical protein